ncbi:MAG: DUF721 domain-containing protein [Desulfovibrio sp.]|nr:DUF721 domain-containing protein [Desulfovibrio sp.]
MRSFRKRAGNSGPVKMDAVMPAVLKKLGMSPGEGGLLERLRQLWRHWEMVMGPELADLAQPLGRHGDVLHIGAEDSLMLQELQFQSGEILERVNAFMEKPVFTAVKVELLMGRRGLVTLDVSEASDDATADWRLPRTTIQDPVTVSGKNLVCMTPDSPVARAYAAFVRRSRSGAPVGDTH